MRPLGFAAGMMLLVAGCIAPASQGPLSETGLSPPGFARIALPLAVPMGDALVWQGKTLHSEGLEQGTSQYALGKANVPCGAQNCERTRFHVDGPARVQVAVEADDTGEDYSSVTPTNPLAVGDYLTDNTFFFQLHVLDATGREAGKAFDSMHQGSLAILDSANGDYDVQVIASAGSAAYRGALRVLSADPTPTGGLPDLAVVKPSTVFITAPLGREAAPATDPVLRGCGGDEVGSAKAMRCLRYDTRILNLGPGDFEERLAIDQAEASLLQQPSAHWTQRIHAGDRIEDVPSGPAYYHAVHGHFHLNGLQRAFVYAYDVASKARGQLVAQGQKTGLCMVDGGIVDITGIVPAPNPRDNGCCYMAVFCPMDAANRKDFVQGISPGWFDTYPWWRADQYVEITGVPDGAYELVVAIDPDRVVREANYDNNEASVLLELQGDHVTLLA